MRVDREELSQSLIARKAKSSRRKAKAKKVVFDERPYLNRSAQLRSRLSDYHIEYHIVSDIFNRVRLQSS